MAIKKLNPYLNFPGTAAKAIRLYETALGAKAENVMPWQDMPGQPPNPEAKDRIMHAVLHLGAGDVMLSDTPPGVPVPPGGNQHVMLDFDDAVDMVRKFEALSMGQDHHGAPGYVLGREVRHAHRRPRRAVDVQLREPEELSWRSSDG